MQNPTPIALLNELTANDNSQGKEAIRINVVQTGYSRSVLK